MNKYLCVLFMSEGRVDQEINRQTGDADALLVFCDEEGARCERKAVHVLVDVSALDVWR